ncbi:acetate--CoA ligase family protein [Actinomadura viridis]|uniref:Acyl-CoA synthetase (NDP forming) n=1 Tax=Actinomadura viridis TaxID=58110 RepID=A0A931GMS3_9ACTN|nr:acetate--CoA ligase family protein [Actinomadura viridis]MBG6092972.1 acyl-CoA synthetase (NDP forming) [Actinomadura viridis]
MLNQLAPEQVKPGPLAIITQSGAANNTVYNRAQAAGIGVGLAIATGVQLALSTWDALDLALSDDRVEVAAMVVEELGPLERFRPVLRRARDLGKPVVLLKAGRTRTGGAAVATHSGALAGDWEVQRAALAELGVVIADDLDRLWEVASLLLRWGRPARRPVRLGAAAFSGGEGAVIADLADDAGLELPPVTEEFAAFVGERLTLAGAANPFDPTGEVLSRPDDGIAVLDAFVGGNDHDVTLFALNTQAGGGSGGRTDGLLTRILDGVVRPGTRLAVSYWPVPGLSDGLERTLLDRGLPVFAGSHRAVGAISRWAAAAPLPAGDPLPPGKRLTVPPGVAYSEARAALAALGVPFAPARTAVTVDEAVDAAAALGHPVVLKGDVPSTTHKAAAGLVRLDLRTPADVAAAFAAVTAAGAPRVVVERQVRGTAELFAGVSMDAELGPVLVFGSGGSPAEHLADTAVCPVALLDTAALDRLITATGAGRFLAGRRPELLPALRGLLGILAAARAEIDLNPVAVTGDGLVALDARIAA